MAASDKRTYTTAESCRVLADALRVPAGTASSTIKGDWMKATSVRNPMLAPGAPDGVRLHQLLAVPAQEVVEAPVSSLESEFRESSDKEVPGFMPYQPIRLLDRSRRL